ncbi:multidrug ABC transporter permease [Paenibacillus sp. J31TS4]|nr:multidrug ABC transporter permease [Paenibacillus sp. J31TS4]
MQAMPWFFLLCVVVAIVHGMSYGLITLVSQHFFDAVTQAVAGKTAVHIAVWLGIGLGAVNIGSQVLNGVHNFMGNTFLKKMSGYLTVRMNAKASRLDPVAYETPALLDDINKADEGMTNSLFMLFTVMNLFVFYVPYFLFMGFYLYQLKPLLAISLLLVFVPVAASQLIRSVVFARLEDKAAPIRREFEYYERCIGDRDYFKETRLLGAFGFFRELYRTSLVLLNRQTWTAESRTGLLEIAMRLLTLAGYVGVLYLLFDALLKGEISIGAFSAVFASIDMMFGIMKEIVSDHFGSISRNLGTVRNFIRFLDMPERGGRELAVDAGGGIVLAGARFRYPGAGTDALSGVDLEVEPGETIAIVGENGAGKTTLVKLLTGLYLPTEGSVRIGGVDTRDVSAPALYRGISGVLQKYQRYKLSLRDNVAISGRTDGDEPDSRDDDRLELAARKAELDAGSPVFPTGWETMLSREFDGVDLSGGQWQRVAIARGFYRAHELVVLDEPTAAIDPVEETRLYRQFAEIARGKTSIIVTHRLGSARIADRIVVVEEGRLAAIGTHEELLQAGGKYAEMYRAQAQWYGRDEEEDGSPEQEFQVLVDK